MNKIISNIDKMLEQQKEQYVNIILQAQRSAQNEIYQRKLELKRKLENRESMQQNTDRFEMMEANRIEDTDVPKLL